jgi:thiamine pyrophosphate-dependent acetolactate synthase large subunit-like protein
MPRALEIAMQTAVSRRGVSVIALPGDVALRDASLWFPILARGKDILPPLT